MRNTQNHAWNLVQNLTMQRLVYWEKYSWHRCCQKPWTWIKVGLQHMIKELHALNLCKDWATDRSSESETMKAGTQTDVYWTWKHYDLPVYRTPMVDFSSCHWVLKGRCVCVVTVTKKKTQLWELAHKTFLLRN